LRHPTRSFPLRNGLPRHRFHREAHPFQQHTDGGIGGRGGEEENPAVVGLDRVERADQERRIGHLLVVIGFAPHDRASVFPLLHLVHGDFGMAGDAHPGDLGRQLVDHRIGPASGEHGGHEVGENAQALDSADPIIPVLAVLPCSFRARNASTPAIEIVMAAAGVEVDPYRSHPMSTGNAVWMPGRKVVELYPSLFRHRPLQPEHDLRRDPVLIPLTQVHLQAPPIPMDCRCPLRA